MGGRTGSPDADGVGKPVAPYRGRLHFEDFIDNTDRPRDTLFRIGLDERRGAVRKGAYQVIEAPYAPGEDVSFTGVISYFAANSQEADEIKRYIEVGLRWITSLGAERTVGFGRLVGVVVSEDRQSLPAVNPQPASGATKLEFELTPKAPFCIARRRINNNLFESEIVIPGGVLKGCIATSWRQRTGLKGDGEITAGMDATRPELCSHFDKLRFTHAFPGAKSKQARPVVAPLSLVKAGKDLKDEVYDVALCGGPILLGNPLAAPFFSIDWKSYEDVQNEFGWPDLYTELRVRTKINRERRKAEDEQLFAYEMVVPRDDIIWYGHIDLSEIPSDDRQAVESQLRGILRLRLQGMGKTKSQVEVKLHPEGTIRSFQASSAAPKNDTWIVTFQTPALLCDPTRLNETSGKDDLFAAYQDVRDQLSNYSLRLVRFFAQQSLAGGFYLHNRFQSGKAYNPYLLTEEGSVFVLQANEDQGADAQRCIEGWLKLGLPLPGWAVESYKRNGLTGNHWTNCAFLPANGFGEIAVNLDAHWSKQPQKGEFYAF